MKLLTYFISILIPFTVYHTTMSNDKPRKELFRQQIDKKHNNYIEVYSSKGAKYGIFYGVEMISNNKAIYYKSNMDSLNWNDKEIRFILNKFECSLEPF